MKKRLVALLSALALSASVLVVPVFALDAPDAGLMAVSHCECGGFAVEEHSPTGYTKYLGTHYPCPEHRNYNCPYYEVEYMVKIVCNRCGTLLEPIETYTEIEIFHIH